MTRRPPRVGTGDYTNDRTWPLAFRRAMYDVHMQIGQAPALMVVQHRHWPVNPDNVHAKMPSDILLAIAAWDYSQDPIPDLPWEHYLMLVVHTMMTGEHAQQPSLPDAGNRG